MFIDETKVFARAGHGGAGSVAFLRESFRPKGGPSGGNGGRGGSVILEASHDINNLVAQFYRPRLIAQNGHPGMGKKMEGSAGTDLIIKVPCGTQIWRLTPDPKTLPDVESGSDTDEVVSNDSDSGETVSDQQPTTLPVSSAGRPTIRVAADGSQAIEETLEEEEEAPVTDIRGGKLVADMVEDGQRFVLCKAGRGGLGNKNFATARRQAPRFAQPGEPGEEGEFRFELRIMAEVGLVGYPNAGKSTLLTAVSKARPKIASYPFTTLHPQIGILEYEDFTRLTICDVPGIIEGAHNNVGLGHEFLRHISRCKILVILVDMAGTDDRAPWDDYKQLIEELELYNPELLKKPRMVVANKMDEEVSADNLKKFRRRIPKTPVMKISAAYDIGIAEFKKAIREAAAKVSD